MLGCQFCKGFILFLLASLDDYGEQPLNTKDHHTSQINIGSDDNIAMEPNKKSKRKRKHINNESEVVSEEKTKKDTSIDVLPSENQALFYK